MKTILLFISITLSSSLLFAQEIFPFKDKTSAKFGYKDVKGKVIVPAKYEFADSLHEGFGAINVGGKLVAGPAKTNGGKWGFIDKTGKEIIAPQYDHVNFFSEGLVAVNKGGHTNEYENFVSGQWGFVDRSNTVIIPMIYDYAKSCKDEVAILNSDGTYDALGIYHGDDSGTWYGFNPGGAEILNFNCTELFLFSEGMGRILQNGKYGFINKIGKEIIPHQYDQAEDFHDGKAKVQTGGKEFYIGPNGVEVF